MKSNHELHKEQWLWCSENPEKDKRGWRLEKNIPRVLGDCYACDFTDSKYSKNKTRLACEKCPIDWETTETHHKCQNQGTIYSMWLCETNLEKRSIMAEVIACKDWVER